MPKPFLFLPPKQQFSRVEFHGFGVSVFWRISKLKYQILNINHFETDFVFILMQKSNLVQPKNEERETILEEAIRAFAVKNELPGF